MIDRKVRSWDIARSFGRSSVLALLVGMPCTQWAYADCVTVAPSAADKKSYADAYALFLKAAPAAPSGWAVEDTPSDARLTSVCAGGGGPSRHFVRNFANTSDSAERMNQAKAASQAASQRQQEREATNKSKIEALDAKLAKAMDSVQKAATAGDGDKIESASEELNRILAEKGALMGSSDAQAEQEGIQAQFERDASATFVLSFSTEGEPGLSEPKPYKTVAGRALVAELDNRGVPAQRVHVSFPPSRLTAEFEGDPKRVRSLVDATDLKALAAFAAQTK
jgi:hypothetical protein